MGRARVWAGAGVLSACGAVAFAGWEMMKPRPETFSLHPSLQPSSFNPHSFVAMCGLLGLVWALTGLLLVRLRPRNALGWLVLGIGVSQAWAVGLTAYGGFGVLEAARSWPAFVGTALYMPGWLLPATLLLAIYPDGRLPDRRWRWPVAGAVGAIVLLTVCIPLPVVGNDEAHGWAVVPTLPDRLGDVLLPYLPMYQTTIFVSPVAQAGPVAPGWWPVWTSVGAWTIKPVLAACMLAIWAGTVVRMMRARPPRRQQLRWLVCVVLPCLPASLLAPVEFANVLVLAPMLLVPVAVAIGALRYRLLGIEAVLRRGLVYGTVTAVLVGVYLLVSATSGALLEGRRPVPSAGVVAAVLVAFGLAPARDRLQRVADRLIYGERQDPMRAVTLLGQRLAQTGELDLLPGALASVMTAVRAPGAAVTAADGRLIASHGTAPEPTPGSGTAILSLWFGGQRLGELRVAPRSPGQGYAVRELRLLAALALQVAVVVRAFELTEALEAERDRVLAATTTERARIRAELHDGLGPSLSGLSLGLQALAETSRQPGAAALNGLVDRMKEEADLALGEVRRIIDGLRPAPLDTMTLPDAVRRHIQTICGALPVEVTAADLPTLPPQVENAAYRITTEALNNAARHARAHRVRVTMSAPDGALHITVADDGCGLPPSATVAGNGTNLGLGSMRSRAEALGGQLAIASTAGGTTVSATLPLGSA